MTIDAHLDAQYNARAAVPEHVDIQGDDLPANVIHSGLAISGLYALEPLRHTRINEAVGMDADTAERNSPALCAAAGRAPLTVAVGGLESAEFHRQAESLAKAWRGTAPLSVSWTCPAPTTSPSSKSWPTAVYSWSVC